MSWWIATVGPSLEFQAARDIERAGLETWLPLRCVQVRSRHYAVRKRPFVPTYRPYPEYPGYLFVRVAGIEPGEAWWRLRATKQVRSILTNDGHPLVISDDRMACLAGRMVCSTMRLVEDAWRIGEAVVVTEGPFASFTAFIASALQGERIVAEIDMMGRKTPVEFEIGQLAKVA